jgi:hypothetical protein
MRELTQEFTTSIALPARVSPSEAGSIRSTERDTRKVTRDRRKKENRNPAHVIVVFRFLVSFVKSRH